MEFSDNLYRAPQSPLASYADSDGITAAMAETLAKGAFWARVVHVGYVLAMIAATFGLGFYAANDMAQLRRNGWLAIVFIALIFLIFLLIGGYLAQSMHRYAKAAKALRFETDAQYVEECLFYSTRHFKILGVLSILSLIVGLFSAVALLQLGARF